MVWRRVRRPFRLAVRLPEESKEQLLQFMQHHDKRNFTEGIESAIACAVSDMLVKIANTTSTQKNGKAKKARKK